MNEFLIDLGFRCRQWQAEVFRALLRFSILVVHRGAGKTYLAVLRLVDEALTNGGPMSLYAYVAPELKQAKGIAWEILKHFALKVKAERDGVTLAETTSNEAELWVQFPNGARVQLFGGDHFDSIRGRHFSGIVIDEVAQMKREVWLEVILPALGNKRGWALFIGTPKGINLFSEIYHSSLSDPAWCHKKLTCNDTDVYTQDELRMMRAQMGDRAFRQEMLCDFMASSDNNLITLDDANAAASRAIRKDRYDYAPLILGVDVAWQGGDRSVIFPRQGLQAFKPTVAQGLPEKNFAGKVASIWERDKADACFVDTTGGYGGEVCSRLWDLGFMAIGVKFSESPNVERFLNKRAEMWFKLAEWLKEGSIPNDPGLIAELCAPTYDNDNASMRLKLESKADIRERLGVSPDCADALALTFAQPVAQRSYVAPSRESLPTNEIDEIIAARKAQAASELYDPFKHSSMSAAPKYNPFSRRQKNSL